MRAPMLMLMLMLRRSRMSRQTATVEELVSVSQLDLQRQRRYSQGGCH